MSDHQQFVCNTPKPVSDFDADLRSSIIEHLLQKIRDGACSRDDSGIEVYEVGQEGSRNQKPNP